MSLDQNRKRARDILSLMDDCPEITTITFKSHYFIELNENI